MKSRGLFGDRLDRETVPEYLEDCDLGVVRTKEVIGDFRLLRSVSDMGREDVAHDSPTQIDIEPLIEVLDEVSQIPTLERASFSDSEA